MEKRVWIGWISTEMARQMHGIRKIRLKHKAAEEGMKIGNNR